MQPWKLWVYSRYCLGNSLCSSAVSECRWRSKRETGHTAATSKLYSRYCEKALGLKFHNSSHQLAILFSWKGAQLNKLWQTHRAMLLPLTQVPKQHIQAVRKCCCLTTVEEKKSSKGTNKENLTQSPINGISSIYLLMIKCCHCSLVAKFNDDRHLGKQADRQKDRYPQLL